MIRALSAQLLHSLRHQKLSQDIAYSLGSFVVLAISGIVINIVVTAQRDVTTLGVFNIAYAVYILASQFAVWGLHYSVLRHTAYHQNDASERGRMLCTAGVCAVGMGLLAAVGVMFAEPLFLRIFQSEVTARAIGNAALGLSVFPLNKVLLAYLNGLRAMRAFSVLQALRYFLVMLLVAGIASTSMPAETLTLCFVVAEAGTALAAMAFIARYRLAGTLGFTRTWAHTHYRFGSKGLVAGMFTEINSRVDVLMIGFFLSERETGIYSFAVMLVDGLYQVLAMVRINFNPMLVAALRDGDHGAMVKLRRQSATYVLPTALVLAAGLLLGYYLFATFVMPSKGLMEGFSALVVLLCALVGVSFLVPFDNLMMVSGHPGYQTGQQMTTVTANVLVAAALLPSLGMAGAAAGTAASYVAGTAMLIYLAKRIQGWNLLANTFRA
ncbi:hypothetical protein GY15_31325 [Delftia sp. 670]|jgi:O-antigen/teichoic acid export membrane protein|uniref:lipopolysaccharide biosynthesis protein n=1 Tax=Delftia TaxID=80865 RepID=UPI0004DAF351|nr:polysaccharide biosynthesis C-terminal domain-containing protein [Delftia lacustris]KEH09641.1 hypothetical protein GY15_31325 [Delftia sp. 670]BDE69895.1 hypothetical protein HQS1_10190 [Delftia lacustris]